MEQGHVIDGKYRVDGKLGEGGMGLVVAATHLQIGSTVAIKMLKPRALEIPEAAKRFMREARAAGRLRSEHIGKVIDVGELPTGAPYLVMELLRGNDLASQIKNGPLSPELAAEYIAQACEGLAEAHSLGMVHRDLKPANLFVATRSDGSPLVKVLDFGIATAAYGDFDRGMTSTQSILGSPGYMSPEQLRSSKEVDARSDIWSLGVTLYELLSCRQPFVGETITALMLAIVSEPHAPLTGVPPELVSIIDRCLAKEPSVRFESVAELASALARLFADGARVAERVRGALSQPATPTLELADLPIVAPTPLIPVDTSTERPTVSLSASTTNLTAGESSSAATPQASSRSRLPWLVGVAVAALVLVAAGVAIRGTSSVDDGVQPTQQPVAPIGQPAEPPPAPPAQPAPPAPVKPAREAPVADVASDSPPVKPAVKRGTSKPPARRDTPAVGAKAEPKQAPQDRTPEPRKEQPEPEPRVPGPKPEPKPEPVEVELPVKPCLPNDPNCGL